VAATETHPAHAREQSTVSGAPSPALAPPPGNPRFALFDGLRGIAVLGILAFHASEFTGQLGLGVAGRFYEVAGGGAVLVFFAISGFLLYRPYVAAHARRKAGPAAAIYARRRALRILPGYWAALTLLAIYPAIAGVFSHDWWRYYGYLQLYSGRTVGRGIPVAWTLCVEVAFYITLPLWAIAVRRLSARLGAAKGSPPWLVVELSGLAVVAAVGLTVQLAAADRHVGYLVESSLAGQCLWLAIGMALAVLSVAVEHGEARLEPVVRFVRQHAGACWVVAVGAFAGLMALVPSGGLFGLITVAETRQSVGTTAAKIALDAVFVSLLIAPAVFGDERSGVPRRLLRARPVVWLGVISYSFYLWHLTIVEVIATPGRGTAFSAGGLNLLGHVHTARTLVLFLVSLAATVVIASISYRFIELPFLRRK
jgi:peptidoglycan/LPS O-acetylase OafA/YrhL